MNSRGLIEGDYIETIDGLFFTVKGIQQRRNLVIAYLRYLPDPKGDRERDGNHYRRIYGLDETQKILETKYPRYINEITEYNLKLQSVPIKYIKRVFKPTDTLRRVLNKQRSKLEKIIARFVNVLSIRSSVSTSSFGISGSLLINLDTPISDIDLIVYGRHEGRRVYEVLARLREDLDWVQSYNAESVKEVLTSRWKNSGYDLEKLSNIEEKKVLHGRVDGIDYFIRLVNPNYVFEKSSRPLGIVELKARIINDDESIFTPCRYIIKTLDQKQEISELLSYRGKFTEQAKRGEIVKVRGSLEEADFPDVKLLRVVLGRPDDYLVPFYS